MGLKMVLQMFGRPQMPGEHFRSWSKRLGPLKADHCLAAKELLAQPVQQCDQAL